MHRARVWFAAPGIAHIRRIVTDNGACCRAKDFEMMDKAAAAAMLIDAYRHAAPATGIGCCSPTPAPQQRDLTAPGPDRLIAVGKYRELTAAAREHPTRRTTTVERDPIKAMAHRLRAPNGMPSNTQRGHIAETPSPTPNTTSGPAASPAAESRGPQLNSASMPWCTTCSKPSEPATSPQRPARRSGAGSRTIPTTQPPPHGPPQHVFLQLPGQSAESPKVKVAARSAALASPRVVSAALAGEFRVAASIRPGEVPVISTTPKGEC